MISNFEKNILEQMLINKIKKERAKKIIKKYSPTKILAIGRHSIILKKDNKCFKVEKDIPAGKNACLNEYKNLMILHDYSWIVKNIEYDKGLRVFKYDYVEGVFLPEFIEKNLENKERIKRILKKCLKICYTLDIKGYNKLEMHKPVKHIIISKYDKIIFLDFERMYPAQNTKNVTQFTTYLFFNNKTTKKMFKIKKNKLLEIIKEYKINKNKKNFEKILKLLE